MKEKRKLKQVKEHLKEDMQDFKKEIVKDKKLIASLGKKTKK